MTRTQPSTSLKFRDLVIAVAEFLGVASYGSDGKGQANVPEDEQELALCKRIVNTAYRKFILAARPGPRQTTHLWRFLNQYFTMTLTATAGADSVDNDPGRYLMPWYFNGVVLRDWEFEADQYHHSIRVVSTSEVQGGLSATSDTTGPPRICAFRRLPPANKPKDERRLWEAVFFPIPSETLIINIMLRAYPTGLQDLDDYHFAGAEHDAAIEAACISQAELQFQDKAGPMTELYHQLLEGSIAMDQQATPRSVGMNLDAGQPSAADRHWFTGVDEYNGVPLERSS